MQVLSSFFFIFAVKIQYGGGEHLLLFHFLSIYLFVSYLSYENICVSPFVVRI